MTQPTGCIQKRKASDNQTKFCRAAGTSNKFFIIFKFFIVFFVFSSFILSYISYYHYSSIKTKANTDGKCEILNDAEKFDCHPEEGGNTEECNKRGCCWGPKVAIATSSLNVPWCYYPKSYTGYKYVNITANTIGITAFLERKGLSAYPNDVKLLRMDVQILSENSVRVKVTDANKTRFESPYPKLHPPADKPPQNTTYKVDISKDKSGFTIRRQNGDLIFDTQDVGGFIYADQFIQLSARFNGSIYGLGEHQTRLRLDTNWTRLTMFNQDSVPMRNMNLYGSQPFYLVMEPSGNSHGVFLLNSNAMDILLQPLPAITFRTIGGILDLYFLLGPSPANVISQYTEIVGRPFLPPYWSLGFHLCRLGYKNVSHVETVLNRTKEAGIPVETQWVDIDYMISNNDFTVNNSTFDGLQKFIDDLHNSHMYFIPILDPGISGSEPEGSYPPYDEGIKLDLLIKNENDSIFHGKVWNKKTTVFPDFTNPKSFFYWTGLIHELHDKIPFDGLWIDMNEPSNFIDGSFDGCPNNNLEHPPYVPAVGGGLLSHKTVCMSSKQHLGRHYDLHNLHGISEADATSRALREILQKRFFVISRATFLGSGRYAGHWSGDVASTWEDMMMTVPQMLSFSLYGIPMMGSDICGFNGNTTKYLCLRWSQLGAFYPFARNHNTDDGIDQDPVALGKDVAESARKALAVRYSLLPYLYTLFWRAHVFGETVARPLFFEFPFDKNTHDIDQSFLWGCCVLIVPVLKDSVTTVDTYLPAGRWYDWYTHLGTETNGTHCTLAAGTDTIPVLIRGGSVLPTQEGSATTAESRLNKMTLIAAYDVNLTASGSLYWDEGDGIHTRDNKTYGIVNFDLNKFNMTSTVKEWGLKDAPILGQIRILGFVKLVNSVSLNETSIPYNWNSTNLVLALDNLQIPINVPFTLTWTF